MKILLTNDDGVSSPGILALKDILSREHEVWLIAPDGDRSGYSHAITLREPVRISSRGEGIFACSGTPADCVLYGLGGFLEHPVDLVLSGINLGPNLGTDILFSGTAAAARQGTLKGIPAIALSMDSGGSSVDLREAAAFVSRKLDSLMSLRQDECFLNINFPLGINEESTLKWTSPAHRIYRDEIVRFDAPGNHGSWFFLKPAAIRAREKAGSDAQALKKGFISIANLALGPGIKAPPAGGLDVFS